MVWLRFRRFGFRFCNVACFGVVSLIRGIYCGGPCVSSRPVGHRTDRQSALDAARAAPRPAPPQPARRSLRVAVDYFLLSSNLDATGAFSLFSMCLRPRRVHVYVEGYGV